MPEEKAPPAPTTAVAEPIADAAAFDAFAGQAASTAVWSDAVKPQLPKKPDKP